MGVLTDSTLYQMCITFYVAGVASLASCFTATHHRSKRSLLQLCNLVHEHSDRNCMDYNNYGCFCGYGNAGEDKKPVDKIDACCRKHDNCYGETKCRWALPHMMSYQTDCKDSPKRKHKCKCVDSMLFTPCLRTTCECDVQIARCFTRHKFNPEFMNYDHSKCQPKKIRRRHSKRKKKTRKRKLKHHKSHQKTLHVGNTVRPTVPITTIQTTEPIKDLTTTLVTALIPSKTVEKVEEESYAGSMWNTFKDWFG